MFPVHSRYLSHKYDLRSVEFYQSKFMKFVMKELVYIQIKEFNPSIIVISMSNRLHLDPPFLEEMLKELTVIANMRLLLYNNLARSYAFEQPLPAPCAPLLPALLAHRDYARAFDRRSALLHSDDLNLTILLHSAMFLKVASGTWTLERGAEEDSVREKYDIFRVQKYAGTLIKLIGRSHPVLERFRNRCNEYLRLERMLATIYEQERTSEDPTTAFPLYHHHLLIHARGIAEEMIRSQKEGDFLKRVSLEEVEGEWEEFALRYRVGVKKEREEEEYKYVTRLRRRAGQGEEEDFSADFIALEF